MRKANILFSIFVLELFAIQCHCINRADVVKNAYDYTHLNWTVNAGNILDEKEYVLGSTTPVSGHDGIDDRMGVIVDYDGNKIIDRNDISPANVSNWPYYIRSEPFTGEAYAWAGSNGSNLWGADSTETFKNRIGNQSVKWIAGKSDTDVLPVGAGYAGFTGIDCSGLVGNALNINRFAADHYKYDVSQLKKQMKNIELEDMKEGDIFASNGHILMFKNWVVKYNKAHVIHAVPYKYSDGEHVRRVIEEDVEVKRASGITYLSNEYQRILGGSNWVPHGVYTAFPRISCIKCGLTDNKIELSIKSKSKINKESIRIVVDEGTAQSTTIYAQDLEITSNISGDIYESVVSWPAALNLSISNKGHVSLT